MFTKTGMLFDKGKGNLEAFLSTVSLNYASDVSEVSMYSENKTRILPLTFLILQDTFRKTNTFAILDISSFNWRCKCCQSQWAKYECFKCHEVQTRDSFLKIRTFWSVPFWIISGGVVASFWLWYKPWRRPLLEPPHHLNISPLIRRAWRPQLWQKRPSALRRGQARRPQPPQVWRVPLLIRRDSSAIEVTILSRNLNVNDWTGSKTNSLIIEERPQFAWDRPTLRLTRTLIYLSLQSAFK